MIRLRPGRSLVAAAIALGLIAAPAGPASADSIRDRQWHLTALDVADAQRISTGAGVTVALVDSGVKAEHRDLRAAILPGFDATGDGRGDGRDDPVGHGTEMAGIIAGRGHGGGSGILGIAPGAKIFPAGAAIDGPSNGADIARAIDQATKSGAKVMNLSFARPAGQNIREAIQRARAADIVVVAGSGNTDRPAADRFPALYPEVLSVGAVDRDGKLSKISVTNEGVDIVAPGQDIATTGIFSSGYSIGTGTSPATAMVSGAAALIRSKYPDLSAADVIHRLTATATDAGPKGRDDSYGFGRLNLVKALTAEVGPAPAESAAAPAASAGATAAAPVPDDDPQALPLRKVLPIVLAVGAGLIVLAIGIVVIVLMIRRQRT